MRLTTVQLPVEHDALAPDGSEIRLLGEVSGGSFCHCTLPPSETSLAVEHRSVEEIWYFLSGSGQVWRKLGEDENVVETQVGLALTIPFGTHFQFRNVGTEPLTFVIATIPPWPGEHEAQRVADHWPV